jgi:lysophospholipase L1-like esterase
MHMPTDGAGAIGTRVSHSRELVSEVYTKTGLTWRYYRDGVLMGSRVLTVHGNPAAAFQLFSNNGSNAAGCDLFELAYFPGLALDALQVALWHQFAASEYSSDLFKADVRRTGDLMMFGDSFISATVVDNGRGVSRNTLAWKEAVAGRMPGVALVGTQTATNTHNHEGVGGNTLDQMDARIAAAVDTNTPDVLVLYGGLNDMAGGESGADALLDLESVLATAFAAQPGVSYRVVDLAPHSNGTINARIAAFNAGLDAAIANIRTDNSGIDVERITAGSTLTVADHLDGTDHPNEAGARILANLTVDAVAPLFSVSP